MTRSLAASLTVFVFLLSHQVARAQSLPAPARTVYQCVVAGKTVYTDEPCLGAQRVDVEPTRGINHTSGQERIGRDVAREKQDEQFAEAAKPLTGMTPQQFEVQRRRVFLTPDAKAECARLDRDITEAEVRERGASTEDRLATQARLLALRKRGRALKF